MRYSKDFHRYLQIIAVITAILGAVGYVVFYAAPADWEPGFYRYYLISLVLTVVILALYAAAFCIGPKVGPIGWTGLRNYLIGGLLFLVFQVACYCLVLAQGAGALTLSESVFDFMARERWGFLYAIGFLFFLRKTGETGGRPLG